MQFIDSHCHLQDKRYDRKISAVLDRSTQAGVTYMICCATGEDDWEAVALLADTYEMIIPSFGIHPWFISNLSHDWDRKLEEYLRKIPSGVGECGLDFAREGCDVKIQEEIFKKQLYIANKLKRPVNMHCRRAWQRLIPIIQEVGFLQAGGIIHSYSGSHEMVKILESLNINISFSGSVTRPNSKKGPKAIRAVHRDRLLLETDSPDILPSGITGPGERMLNEPAFIRIVAEKVALIKNMTLQSVADITYTNALHLYRGIIS